MLATLHRMNGVDCVILRFPSLIHRGPAPGEILFKDRLSEGFSYLTYGDAANAVVKVVEADLPGCRTYLPASGNNGHGRPASELIPEFYPDVPLKSPPGTGRWIPPYSRLDPLLAVADFPILAVTIQLNSCRSPLAGDSSPIPYS